MISKLVISEKLKYFDFDIYGIGYLNWVCEVIFENGFFFFSVIIVVL